MTIDEWKKLCEILEKEHSIFLLEYPKRGRGLRSRNAERKVEDCIQISETWIRKYPDAFHLLTEGDQTSNLNRDFIFELSMQKSNYGGEMPRFLEKIKKKISLLEQENN